MATDPVRRIRRHALSFESIADFVEILTGLAGLPPTVDAPYLTLCLDWRPLGSDPGRRLALEQFERDAADVLARFGPRGVAFDSISSDIGRIRAYLNDDLDSAAHGACIVACDHVGVFETLPLGLPLETRLDIGPIPALTSLVRLAEDNVPYAVLVADQQDATLSVIVMASAEPAVDIEGSGYPRRQQTGGISQRNYKARADERLAAFARGVADETRRALDETGVPALIVGGDEIITSALSEAFHQSVTERIAAVVRLDMQASNNEIVAITQPIATQWEREQELRDAQTVRERVLAGGAATQGATAVLRALATGQASRLVMNDDFDAGGWADYTLSLFGIGEPPREHPAGGDVASIVPTTVRDEMIRLALTSGATVQIVHSAEPVARDAEPGDRRAGQAFPRPEAAHILDEYGGVGAILRYQITPTEQ